LFYIIWEHTFSRFLSGGEGVWRAGYTTEDEDKKRRKDDTEDIKPHYMVDT